jgi:hypothetical protein
MSKIQKTITANQDLILKGVMTIGVLVIANKVAQSFGFLSGKSEKNADKDVDGWVKDTLKKQSPTQSKGYWASIANRIHEALRYSAASDNKSEAERLLKLPKNDADVALLIDTYGKRQTRFFGLPEGGLRTLPELLSSNELKGSRIRSINTDYEKKGIKYRW